MLPSSNFPRPSATALASGGWAGAPAFAVAFLVGGMAAAGWGLSFGTEWETRLVKPPVWPPVWGFWAVWVVLYPCMGIATWLVWRRRDEAGAVPALWLFMLHLALNYSWLPVVHSAKSVYAPVIMDVIVGVFAFASAWVYARISRPALLWLSPYLAWTCVTTALKVWLLTLNVS